MTLIELLVATSLFAVVVTVASFILIQGLHAWSTDMSHADEEDQVLVATSRLVERLTKTDPRSLTMYQEPAGVYTPAPDGLPAPALSLLAGVDDLPLANGTCGTRAGAMEWNRYEVWYEGPDPKAFVTGKSLWLQTVWLHPKTHGPDPTPKSLTLSTFTPDPTQDQVQIPNINSFRAWSPMESACLATDCQPVYHINPVTFQVILTWNGHSINHSASASMMENTDLDPGLVPTGVPPSSTPTCYYCCTCCPPCCSTSPAPGSTTCPSPACTGCCCTLSPSGCP